MSLLAKTEFAVPRVVARVNRAENEWLFTEQWGVDVSVSKPRLMAALVEEAVTVGDLVRLMTFRQGQANLVEITLPRDRAVRRARRSATCRCPATRRWSRSCAASGCVAPTPDDPLEAGDELVFVCTTEVEDEVRAVILGARPWRHPRAAAAPQPRRAPDADRPLASRAEPWRHAPQRRWIRLASVAGVEPTGRPPDGPRGQRPAGRVRRRARARSGMTPSMVACVVGQARAPDRAVDTTLARYDGAPTARSASRRCGAAAASSRQRVPPLSATTDQIQPTSGPRGPRPRRAWRPP